MFQIHRLAALLCLASCAGPAASSDPGSGRAPALVAALAPVGDAHVGGPTLVEFTLTNAGDAPVRVLTWYTPLEGFRSDLFEVRSEGVLLGYRGLMAKRMAPPPEAYVTLGPGESVRSTLDLAEGYGVSGAGTYRVRTARPFVEVGQDRESVPSAPAAQRLVPLEPVETTIQVLPEWEPRVERPAARAHEGATTEPEAAHPGGRCRAAVYASVTDERCPVIERALDARIRGGASE